jgi:hypothetical protein
MSLQECVNDVLEGGQAGWWKVGLFYFYMMERYKKANIQNCVVIRTLLWWCSRNLQERATTTLGLLLLGVLSSARVRGSSRIGRSRGLVTEAFDLADQSLEGLNDVRSCLGRRLHEGALQLGGKSLSLISGNLTILLQIALVTDQDEGNGLNILHAEDVVVQLSSLIKRVL